MKILAFGQPHFKRMNRQAREIGLPASFAAVFRRHLRRKGRLRALLPRPGRPEAREIGLMAEIGGSDWDRRAAGGAAEATWRMVSRVDAVLVWNGSRGHGLMAAETARRLGKPLVYIENGFLPDTVQIDLKGINYQPRPSPTLDPRSLPAVPSRPHPVPPAPPRARHRSRG